MLSANNDSLAASSSQTVGSYSIALASVDPGNAHLHIGEVFVLQTNAYAGIPMSIDIQLDDST
jgi:hypothetical protein